MFANKDGKFQFVPKSSRVLIPQPPKIKIDALSGRVPDTNYAWFNFYKGALNNISPIGKTQLFNAQKLWD